MRHLLTGITLAMLAGLVFASSASAITIYDVKATALVADPYDWSNAGTFGTFGYSLMWSNLDAADKFLAGHPTGNYTTGIWKNNPGWLNFQTGLTGTSGSGTYTPSGTISGNVTPRFYTLKSNSGGHRFDFSFISSPRICQRHSFRMTKMGPVLPWSGISAPSPAIPSKVIRMRSTSTLCLLPAIRFARAPW